MRPVSKTIRLVAGAFASSAAIAPGELGALASRATLPLRSTTQMCVSFIEMSNPAKYSMIALLLYLREPILSAPRRTATSLPHVAKVFCRLWRATLIRNDEQQRNFDSLQPGF